MSEALSISTVKTLCALPADPSGVEDGLYTIEALDNHTVSASDDQIKSEVWFKSPVRLHFFGKTRMPYNELIVSLLASNS